MTHRLVSLPRWSFLAICGLTSACSDLSVAAKPDDPPIVLRDTDTDTDAPVDTGTAPEATYPVLEVTPDFIDFGYVEEGTSVTEPVTLRNVGDGALQVWDIQTAGSTDVFDHEAGGDLLELAPGESTVIDVVFTADATDATGMLGFLSNDLYMGNVLVDLEGTGRNPMAVGAPSPIHFADTVLGALDSRTLEVSNPGNVAVTVFDVASTHPDFVVPPLVAPLVIDPGASATVDVSFVPTSPGVQTGLLRITSDARLPAADVPVDGLGLGRPEAVCSATPPVVPAGGTATFVGSGSSDPQGRPLTYDWTLTTIPSGSTVTLAGMGTGPDRGPLVPDRAGTYGATLVVTNDLGLSSDPCMASFYVNTRVGLVASPDPLAFGGVPLGADRALPLTIRNDGNLSATITQVVSSDSHFVPEPVSPTPLAPGATMTVGVTYTPDGAVAHQGMITVSSLASGTATVLATGNGTVSDPVAVCYATPSVATTLTTNVTLVGSGSTDPQGSPLSYSWTLTGVPAGSALSLAGLGSGPDRGPFLPDRAGTYSARLVVTNALGRQATCNTSFSVDSLPLLEATPDPMAFGSVNVGDQPTRTLTVRNVGNDAALVTAITSNNPRFQPPAFAPRSLQPGATTTMDIRFVPDSATAFNGVLTVLSNAPNETVTVRGTGVSADPIAVCSADPPTVVALHESARFLSTGSYDPQGRPITGYTWTLVSQPGGSSLNLSGSGPTLGPFTPLVVGEYTVQLVVRNDLGRSSAPCFATVRAEPNADLWIEMFWQYSGDDMDLHLIRNGSPREDTYDDCHFRNCKAAYGGLSWGNPGTADDAFLDRDDISGTGPENINVASPQPGPYRVEVHDWPGSTYNGANNVTVRVYVNGINVFDDTRAVSGEDTWTRFVRIDWNANGTANITPL